MLRLPDGMRERIKAAAADNNRSMNAEIVSTLEEAYPKPKPSLIPRIAMTLLLGPQSIRVPAAKALRDASAEEGGKASESIEELLSSVDVIETEELVARIEALEEVFERAILLSVERGILPGLFHVNPELRPRQKIAESTNE